MRSGLRSDAASSGTPAALAAGPGLVVSGASGASRRWMHAVR